MESQSSEEQREEAEAGAVAETVELVLRGGKDQAIEVVAGHELQLTNVEPHPKEGVTTERGAHVVTVEVLRL